ncbi:unnamed protein product, partial [Meganyctiphanes norvegica]
VALTFSRFDIVLMKKCLVIIFRLSLFSESCTRSSKILLSGRNSWHFRQENCGLRNYHFISKVYMYSATKPYFLNILRFLEIVLLMNIFASDPLKAVKMAHDLTLFLPIYLSIIWLSYVNNADANI